MSDKQEYEQLRVFASLPRTTRGLPVVLGLSPKGDKITYTNGNSVYTVDIDNITKPDIYTEHSVPATVAKISPSGYYCASGDNSGNIRIWDTTQSTHILKAQYSVFNGPVRDIAWNDDSKRIAVVGEGRERFGHVFLFDTGTSNGNLSGQSRPMSSIDFKPTRPYRLVSGSEDNTIAIFEGPPFKFKTTFHEHSRFVHVTRYSPDGALFASAGADGKVVLFEGVEGAKQFELSDEKCKGAAHGGSVFGLTWSPDGKRLATASGDKTVKIWNVEGRTLEKTITIGSEVEDQQLSVIWTKSGVVSVSLNGFLNFVNPDEGNISKIVYGHSKPITATTLTANKEFLFTADFEGNITRWVVATGESKRLSPKVHKSQVVGLFVSSKGTLISIGWDDTVQFTPSVTQDCTGLRPSVKNLPSQPLGLACSADGSIAVVSCYKHVVVLKDENIVHTLPIDVQTTCVALLEGKNIVAVGAQNSKIYIYTLNGDGSLSEKKQLTHAGPLTSVAFSENGEYLVATDGARKVIPYGVNDDFKLVASKEWTFHTAKVNCVAWNPNNRFLATGGLDTNLIIWDLQKSGDHPIIVKGAHQMSPINGLVWLNDNELITVGQDANVKHWRIFI